MSSQSQTKNIINKLPSFDFERGCVECRGCCAMPTLDTKKYVCEICFDKVIAEDEAEYMKKHLMSDINSIILSYSERVREWENFKHTFTSPIQTPSLYGAKKNEKIYKYLINN